MKLPDPLSRISLIYGYCFLLAILGYIDYKYPYLTYLVVYVMLVAAVASTVGGRFSYIYAIAAGIVRSTVQAGLWPNERLWPNDQIFQIVWLVLNVVVANIFVTWLILKKEELVERLQESSLTDPLTQISNRRAFKDRLNLAIAHSQRYGEPLSVAYIDVDRFKAVNDTYGHHRGDDLLVLISNTIKKDLRADDLPARLGGDEFAIIYAHRDGSDGLITRLKKDLDEEVKKHEFDVSFSIGVINYFGDRGVSCEDLVRCADDLMYQVKKSSKNAIRSRTFVRTHGIPT